jgi:thioredoxin reductase (NADPH)
MAQQVLLAVDTDREILTAMERDFSRRFGADYPLLERKPSAGHSGDLLLTLADGSLARSDTVVIATGVTYRRRDVPGLEELLGAGVFYGAAVTEATALKGQRAFVVGGANSAGQAAVHLAASAIQQVHRYLAPS